MWGNRRPYRLTSPEAADRVLAAGTAPPAVVLRRRLDAVRRVAAATRDLMPAGAGDRSDGPFR